MQRQVDLGRRLAHAGKDHAARSLRRGSEHALQFAAGDDVEPCAALGEQLENGQRGVGLDRVAHKVIAARERALKQFQPLGNLAGRVDIERRTEAPGERFERNAAAMERAAGPRIIKWA